MRIAVGSENPLKREATERAFTILPDVHVDSVAVDSGVNDQPRGHRETITGAETRARRALDAGVYDLGVGIEGGVGEFGGTAGLFLIMWAVVTDGSRTGRAAGPSIPLPDNVADAIRAGGELGPVLESYGDVDDVRERGVAGVLTADAIDRVEALTGAVAGALGPFVTDHYEVASERVE